MLRNNLALASIFFGYSHATQLADGFVEPADDEVVIAVAVDDGNLAQISTTEEELEHAEMHIENDGGLAQTSTTMLAQTKQADDSASELQKSVDIWAIQNQIRTQPTSVLDELAWMYNSFEGDTYIYRTRGNTRMSTNEGKAAVAELYYYLQDASPVGALEWSNALSDAAEYHVDRQGPYGQTGHTSSNGKTMSERIDIFDSVGPLCGWEHTIGENISYGSASAMDVVLALLIDDGVPNRGHRVNMFNDRFGTVGVHTDNHSHYRTMTNMDYAGGICGENSDPPVQPSCDWMGHEGSVNCPGGSSSSGSGTSGSGTTGGGDSSSGTSSGGDSSSGTSSGGNSGSSSSGSSGSSGSSCDYSDINVAMQAFSDAEAVFSSGPTDNDIVHNSIGISASGSGGTWNLVKTVNRTWQKEEDFETTITVC